MTHNLQIVSGHERPDLCKAVVSGWSHPLMACWPAWFQLGGCEVPNGCFESIMLEPELQEYQFFVIDHSIEIDNPISDEDNNHLNVVAIGNSVPFFWESLETHARNDCTSLRLGTKAWRTVSEALPDRGWEGVLELAVRQYLKRSNQSEKLARLVPLHQPDMRYSNVKDDGTEWTFDVSSDYPAANTLMGVSIVVLPDQRSSGAAELLLSKMKDFAIDLSLKGLVIPVRPSKKAVYKSVPFEEYVCWNKGLHEDQQKTGSKLSTTFDEGVLGNQDFLPFDPWIRKHFLLGGKIIKIASTSMVFKGSLQNWEELSHCDSSGPDNEILKHQLKRDKQQLQFNKVNPLNLKNYAEITYIPGTHGYIRYYPDEDVGYLVEKDLWVRYF